MSVCLIGLGANLGERCETLDKAIARLERESSVRLVRKSSWRETSPVGGPPGQPMYLNGAAVVETSLGPEDVLAILQKIENELGRRRSERWAARTIDLDLLLVDQCVLHAERLTLPHPKMAWRRFVLESAAEIAPQMVHPTIGWTLGKLLEHLNTAKPYVAIAGPIGVGKTSLAEQVARIVSADRIDEQVDSERLSTFYADPTGHGWNIEIEFLNQRAQLLSNDCPLWNDREQLVVSDFWFDQSLAFAGVWLSAEEYARFYTIWKDMRAKVVQPKLTVLLDAPVDQLMERVSARGRCGEQLLQTDDMEKIRRAIDVQAGEPDVGPVLRLTNDTPERLLDEVVASIRAMK